jgi:tRNA threonylcarbamoyladenosine biosynthesis protein TsaB
MDIKRILAIETSGRHGSVAALQADDAEARPIGQIDLTGNERTAQSLAPAIERLIAGAGWSPKSVELVAVAVGPGSFTGLRIGVTTAKTFAYAVGAEVIGVDTLIAIAAQTEPSPAPLWTILDAQRQELFAAKFLVADKLDIHTVCQASIIPQDRWLAALEPGDRVVGPALKRLAAQLPEGIVALPEELWQPMASVVGQIAWQDYQAGRRDDVWQLVPKYYRPSAAEEKRLS